MIIAVHNKILHNTVRSKQVFSIFYTDIYTRERHKEQWWYSTPHAEDPQLTKTLRFMVGCLLNGVLS